MSDDERQQSRARRLVERIEEGPVRFLVPGVIVAALAVSVVNGYTPLQFQAPEAKASTQKENLDKKVDASKLEKKKPAKKISTKATAGSGQLKDGTYTGYSRCTEDGVFDYWLSLDVTVSGGKVVNISNVKGSGTGKKGSANLGSYDTRNAKYLTWAAKGRGSQEGVVTQLLDSAVKGGSAGSIDTVSGATYSSQSILEAYQDALSQASVSGKSSVSLPSVTKKAASGAASGTPERAAAKTGIAQGAKLADGTWRGYDRCTEEDTFDYYVAVDVTVKNGKVSKLSNVHGSGTGDKGSKNLSSYDTVNDTYLGWAMSGRNGQAGVLKQISVSTAKGKIAESVDTVSGATYSSRSILNAYLDALSKSAKAAGSVAKVPSAKGKAGSGSGDADGSGENGHANGGSGHGGGGDATPENPNSGFADGAYTAYGLAGTAEGGLEFSPYYVGVTIHVADGKISEVTSSDIVGDAEGAHDPAFKYDAGENAYYFKRALNGYGISGKHPGLVKQINNGLAAGSALVTYDTISGATYTSDAIIEAYTQAVALAKQAADAGAAASGESAAGDAAAGDGAQEADEAAGGEGAEAGAGSEAGGDAAATVGTATETAGE